MLEAMYRVGATRRIPLCALSTVHFQPPPLLEQTSPGLVDHTTNYTPIADLAEDFYSSGDIEFENEDEAVPDSLWTVMGDAPGGASDFNTAGTSSVTSDLVDLPSICVTQEMLGVLEAAIQPRGWVLALMAMFAIIFVVGIIGNILVCIAIARFKFVRSVTAVFIASLAISDINVLLICLPVTVIDDVYHTWYWGTTTCKTIKFFQQFFVFVTILTLAMLAAERYATICYYSYGRGCRNYRKRRKCRDAVGIVIAVWVISALLALPEVFRVTSVPIFADSPLLTSCQSDWPVLSDFLLQLFYFAFLFVLPLAVIAFCYYKIVRALSGGKQSEDAAAIPLPADPSCPSLMAPSNMFPTRSRTSSANKKETKISQLQSDYSDHHPPNNNNNNNNQLQCSSNNNSRNPSFSLTPFHTNGAASCSTFEGQDKGKLADIPSAQLRQRWRLTKMLITIVILFLVSYLPVYIYLLTQPFDLVTKWVSSLTGDSAAAANSTSRSNWRLHWDTKTGVALGVHFLVYVNSTVNPVIYYFMSDKFRQAFRKLLWCGVIKRWCQGRKRVMNKSSGLHHDNGFSFNYHNNNKADDQHNNLNKLATPIIPVIIVASNSSTPSGHQQQQQPTQERFPYFTGTILKPEKRHLQQ